MIAQYRLCDRRTQFRIHPAHQHRLFPESLGHPFRKLRLFSLKSIPYPQSVRKRSPVVTAAKQRAVRGRCECRFYFFLRRNEVLVALIVLVFYFGQTHKQLVVVRNMLRCRTRRLQQKAHDQPDGQTPPQSCDAGMSVSCRTSSDVRHHSVRIVTLRHHDFSHYCLLAPSPSSPSFGRTRTESAAAALGSGSLSSSVLKVKMSLKCCSVRRQMKPPPYSCVYPSSQS